MRLFRAISLALLMVGATTAAAGDTWAPHRGTRDWKSFDPQRNDALAWIDVLKKTEGRVTWTWIHEPIRGWIQGRDIPGLLALLDSTERCRGVATGLSSYLPTKHSTVGDEAALMIASFRDGVYPNRLHSMPVSVEDKAELRVWWERRQRDKSVERAR